MADYKVFSGRWARVKIQVWDRSAEWIPDSLKVDDIIYTVQSLQNLKHKYTSFACGVMVYHGRDKRKALSDASECCFDHERENIKNFVDKNRR